ncbi:MAG: hypothetical protein ABIJ43_04580 [Candidatus Beckwithbacteria bacterium]|nr:hypothetical protein [Patescibacteria group bacterium]
MSVVEIEFSRMVNFEVKLAKAYQSKDLYYSSLRSFRNPLVKTVGVEKAGGLVSRLTLWGVGDLASLGQVKHFNLTTDANGITSNFDKVISGSEALEIFPSWVGNIAYLGGLVTLPEFREQGFGEELVTQVISREKRTVVLTTQNATVLNIFRDVGGSLLDGSRDNFQYYYSFGQSGELLIDRKLWEPNMKIRKSTSGVNISNGGGVMFLNKDRKGEEMPLIFYGTDTRGRMLWWGMREYKSGRLPKDGHFFPSQAVIFLNPTLSRQEVQMLVPEIAEGIGRSRWVEIFQIRDLEKRIPFPNDLSNLPTYQGYDLGKFDFENNVYPIKDIESWPIIC